MSGKKSDVGGKSGKKGNSGGPVAISLKYSLSIGRGKDDKIKVGSWLESADKPSEPVVKIRNIFNALNLLFGEISRNMKLVKPGQEGDLPGRVTALDDALGELTRREVSNNDKERTAMINDIAKQVELAKSLKTDIDEAIRIGKLAIPVLTVGGPVRVMAGAAVTPQLLGASVKPSVPLSVMDGTTEIKPGTGFTTPGKRTVRVVAARTETHNTVEKTVEVDVYVVTPVLTVGGPVRVMAAEPVTLQLLGASVAPSLPLSVMDGTTEIKPGTGFTTPGKRTLRVVSAQTVGYNTVEKTVDVDVYVVTPAITVSSSQPTVTVGEAITLQSLGASEAHGLDLKIYQKKQGKLHDLEVFETPGTRSLMLVCEPPPPNERAELPVSVTVVNRKRVISFTALTKPVVWETPITRELLKAEATGPGGGVEIVAPSELKIGPNTYILRAEGRKKEYWDDAVEQTTSVTFHRVPREITWTLPKELPGNTKISAQSFEAEVWATGAKGRFKTTDKPVVTAPESGVLAVGKAVTVTLEVEEEDHHGPATISGEIKVTKTTPKLTWPKPQPAALDKNGQLKLGDPQLNAAVTPTNFADEPVYKPAVGTVLTKAGNYRLDATLAATANSEAATASVVLTVVQNATALRGIKEMNSGEAFVKPVKPGKGEVSDGSYERWQEWESSDEDDPDAIGTMGKRMLGEISLMKPAELTKYLRDLKSEDDKLDPGERKVSHWTDIDQKKHISFKNGLEIRFKPKGDKHTGGKPCFCMEVRKNPTLAVAGGQTGIAFKVTSEGKPAAKGPSQLQYPQNFNPSAQLDYKDGAMASTHLRLL